MNTLETIVKFVQKSQDQSGVIPGSDSIDKAGVLAQTSDILLPIILSLVAILVFATCTYLYFKKRNSLSDKNIDNGAIIKSKPIVISFVCVVALVLFATLLFFLKPISANAIANDTNTNLPSINQSTNYIVDTQQKKAECSNIQITNNVTSYKFALKSIKLEKLDTSINFTWKLLANGSTIFNNEAGQSTLENPILIIPGNKLEIIVETNVSYDEASQLINKDVARISFELEKSVDGNLIKVAGKESFENGNMENLHIDHLNNVDSLVIDNGQTTGTFVSEEINTDNFDKLVCSWSSSFAEGNQIEIWARAKVQTENGSTWTDWLTWGPYSPYTQSGTKEHKKCQNASVEQDIFTIQKGTANAIQLKAVLTRNSEKFDSPKLRQISATFTGGDSITKYAEKRTDIPIKKCIQAPACSQSIRDENMGGSICSPTTIMNMLGSRIHEALIFPEISALCSRDYGEGIFGNWPFCTSYLGCFGFQSYCQYANKDILLQELSKGHTVGINVKYKHIYSTREDLPLLENTYGDTNGHLICLIGYEYEGGIVDDDHLVFYSSDSYDKEDKYCYRKYKWNQLDKCWPRRMAYICPQLDPDVYNEYGYTMKDINLVHVEGNKYKLMSNEGEIDISKFENNTGCICSFVRNVGVDMTKDIETSWHSYKYENPMNFFSNNFFKYYYATADNCIEFIPTGDRLIDFCVVDSKGHLYHTVINPQKWPS